MFNQLIKPGKFPSFNSQTIYLFFCNSGIVPPTRFGHNHYVPLIFCSEKNKANEKRKLVTSQKCKGSKKRAIYFMHHLWKQDLSVKNYLSNFPDHLNVHGNPNISKSSTFNLTADNFSSLDDITQNLHRAEQPFIFNSSISDSIPISKSANISFPENFTVSSSKVKHCLAGSNGIQGKALVRNSLLFSDVTSKCVLSIDLSVFQ